MTRPPIPPGPIVSLVYRVSDARRADVLSFLSDTFPLYERPGGIRMGVYEGVDDPNLWLELVAYAGEAEYAADQERVERDPEMVAALARWRALLDGPVEVRRLRPLLPAAVPAPARSSTGASPALPAVGIDDAAFNDHAAVAELLAGCGLPVPDPNGAPVHVRIARDGGRIVGCVGFERHGGAALLRSLAVAPSHRRRGVARALVGDACARLAAAGVREVHLLTLDAADLFARLGFAVIDRAAAPEALQGSRELSLSCCAGATLMRSALPLAR